VACLVDVEDILADMKINIYPNPCHDDVNIDLSGFSFNEASIEILDITGRTIQSIIAGYPDIYQCSISGEPAGLYFIQITMDGKRLTRKLSVAR